MVFSITHPAQKPWVVWVPSLLWEQKQVKTEGKGKNGENPAVDVFPGVFWWGFFVHLMCCKRMKQTPDMLTAL